MRQSYLVLVALVTLVVFSFGPATVAAHEKDRSTPSDNASQYSQEPAEPATSGGYPVRQRRVGGPTDVDWDLDSSFPKRGSLLELILRCLESQES